MTELSTSLQGEALSQWDAPRPKLKGRSILDEIFNRFDGAYPGLWKSKFPSPTSIQNWKDECERTFDDEGVTLQHIAVGLKSYKKLYPAFPPTVQQFANACLPPVDIIDAYHEAVAGIEARGKGGIGAWSHPAIYWAASRLSRELMNMPSVAIKGRWESTLKAELAKGAWEPIPPAREQLPAPGATQLSREDAAAMLAQIGALGILKKASSFDHLRWARLVIERHANGDKRVTLSTLNAAREALKMNEPKDDNE